MTWADGILRQAKENPAPQLPRVELGEFLSGLSSIAYTVILYTSSIAGCQFQTRMDGIAQFSKQGFLWQGRSCLWLFDNDDKWLALPAEMAGSVYDGVWRFEAEHVKIELKVVR